MPDALTGHACFLPPHLWESPDGPVWRARSIDRQGRRITVFGETEEECREKLTRDAVFSTLHSGKAEGVGSVVTLNEDLPVDAIPAFMSACRIAFGHDDGALHVATAKRLGVRFAAVSEVPKPAEEVK